VNEDRGRGRSNDATQQTQKGGMKTEQRERCDLKQGILTATRSWKRKGKGFLTEHLVDAPC
jgi:hypothetical protein